MVLLQEQGATSLIIPFGLGPFLTKELNISAQSPEIWESEAEITELEVLSLSIQHIQLPVSVHKWALWTEFLSM